MKTSIKQTARIAGLLYLVVILGGLFAEIFVRGRLVIHNDAVATANNILAHEQLYRWGFAVELFYCACNVPIIFIFYKLFRVVNRNLTGMVVIFSVIGTAVEAVSLLAHYAPLVLLTTGSHMNGFTLEQLQSLSYLSLRMFEYGFCICLVFFGCYCIAAGYLIYRSTFIPKLIGILLAFEGVCYLANSFANFVAPAFAPKLFQVLSISALGEISFCLWLLIKGVNVPKWLEKQHDTRIRTIANN